MIYLQMFSKDEVLKEFAEPLAQTWMMNKSEHENKHEYDRLMTKI